MNRDPQIEKELNDVLECLNTCTHSPKGQFSSEESFAKLQKHLPKNSSRLLFIKYISAAAAVALICLFSWNYHNTTKVLADITILTNAENKMIKLPDGTTITLNHYSSLTYSPSFDGEKRRVHLKGEAYFEVAKDAKRPFIVETRNVDVRVLGTHFNVEAYANSPETKTTLLEGSVALCNKDKSQRLVLKPNECAIFNKDKGQFEQQAISQAENDIAWCKGNFIFENTPLQEIARELSNSFNVKIEIQSEKLRNYKITARFEHGEKLDEILDLLKVVGNFTYTHKHNTIIIKS